MYVCVCVCLCVCVSVCVCGGGGGLSGEDGVTESPAPACLWKENFLVVRQYEIAM